MRIGGSIHQYFDFLTPVLSLQSCARDGKYTLISKVSFSWTAWLMYRSWFHAAVMDLYHLSWEIYPRLSVSLECMLAVCMSLRDIEDLTFVGTWYYQLPLYSCCVVCTPWHLVLVWATFNGKKQNVLENWCWSNFLRNAFYYIIQIFFM